MNTYGSSNRTYVARNVREATISPPTDIAVSQAGWFTQLLKPISLVQYQENVLLRRVGLFSNFADGLVWADPKTRLQINIEASAAAYLNTFSATPTPKSKALVGAGTHFLTDVNPGDVLYGQTSQTWNLVYTVNNDTSITFADYYESANAGAEIFRVYGVGGSQVGPSAILYGVDLFNFMYELEFPVNVGAARTPPLHSFLKATVYNIPDAAPDPTILTKSIDTAFATDKAFFDVIAEVESIDY
jgi:hypothetical protein